MLIAVIAISSVCWWIISLFFLRGFFRRRTYQRRKANIPFAKKILFCALVVYLGGWACNFAACLANGSLKMPIAQFDSAENIVYPADFKACEKRYDFLHTCITPDTKLIFFIDRFRFFAFDYIIILSFGDFLLIASTVLMTLQRIWIFLPHRKKRIH